MRGGPSSGYRRGSPWRARGVRRSRPRTEWTSIACDARYSWGSPYIPMPMNDGDRHAATNVDRSESFAVAPDCMADVKCDVRMVLACAARASDDGSAMSVDTK